VACGGLKPLIVTGEIAGGEGERLPGVVGDLHGEALVVTRERDEQIFDHRIIVYNEEALAPKRRIGNMWMRSVGQ
jgi:hypothetical protein